ncbi:MarR family winged helix-turn-helix transcriptional regulator [Solimonas marina]|uniref:MarR family transcriptional regulator n=1 Tax=Solimonas marina TaxID=2714601 RepID=A0A970B6R1_9GAMM|nr:MarR family transcriptional regulator [Solimonas marina]NKF22865.1 MarR family transcriptional regulator [Solimonas marina]
MKTDKHPRHMAIERALLGVRERLPDMPYERLLAARLMTHAHKHSQELSNVVLKRHALNYATYSTMMVLYGNAGAGMSASELAAATGEKPTNLTRVCDELYARKLIRREPSSDDRRRIELRLTRAGERLIEEVQPEIWALVSRFYEGFSAAELEQLQSMLGRVLAASLGDRT